MIEHLFLTLAQTAPQAVSEVVTETHLTQDELLWHVIIAGVVSALATGLGAIPFIFIKGKNTPRWQGFCSGAAGGMMIGASVFSLIHEGQQINPMTTVVGLLAGMVFLWLAAKMLHDHHEDEDSGEHEHSHVQQLQSSKLSPQSLLVLLTMFVHSGAEGIAIGVGFATGQVELGLLVAIVISVHNIPEGIAISLPMHSQGISLWKCAWWSVFSSIPQPIVAVPAFLLVHHFQYLVAPSMGFAAGAMLYLVVAELLPESYERCTKHQTAWAVMTGLLAMLIFVILVD
jgi:zinc transporter ZupT